MATNPIPLNPPKYSTTFGEFIGVGPNGNLWVDGCDVQVLAETYGTPLFIVSENQLRFVYRQFRDAFRAEYPEVEILFANKSNNGLAIRHIMNQEGAGGDCFGAQEMYMALLAGTDGKTLVLNGSNKQDDELEMAIANGLCINIDAMDELDRIAQIARGRQVDIGIRLKLDLEPLRNRHGVAMHGPGTLKEQSDSTKWGMTREQTIGIVKKAQGMANIHLSETHFHLSRMSNKAEDFAVMAAEMITWSDFIRDNTGWTPGTIDIGGGWTFGKWYGTGPNSQLDDDKSAPTPFDYAKQISKAIKDEAQRLNLPLPKLRLEPGRALSGPSGIAVGKVGAVKEAAKTWVNLDLSTNHISWSAVLDWYYHAVAVKGADREATTTVDLVGPLCNSDEMGRHRKMPPLKRGDFVAFLDAGGYAESSAARYNAQLLPATVLVSGDRAEVITEREQLRDVVSRFRVPPRLLAGSFTPASSAA